MSRNSKLSACILLAIGIHATIFAATDAGLRAANAALKPYVVADLGSVAYTHRYYYNCASRSLSGKIPYRDFVVEYPILALPLFLIPHLLSSDFEGYRFAFVVEIFLFDVVAIVLIALHGGEKVGLRTVARRLAWYTLYCTLLSPLLIGRYDLAPTVLAFAAASFWFSGHEIAGGIFAGLGMLMKVFPGMVAAPALVWEASRLRITRIRGMAAFLGTLAVGVAYWFWLGGARIVQSLAYHTQRGVEVESLYGGVLFLVGTVQGKEVPWVNNYDAFHVVPEWGASLAATAFPLQVAGLLVVMWRFRHSGMSDGLRYSASAILAFIIFCKVLSPQYLIWLVPFIAVLDGRTGRLSRKMFLLVCTTTVLFYPGPGYGMMLEHQAGPILLLNLRNTLLLGLLALLLFGPSECTAAEVLPNTTVLREDEGRGQNG
jgi:hypothetical protein